LGRKACVILDNGEKTEFFNLLKGTAQGDCPSPVLYNICAQILIFKIELDNSVPSLYGDFDFSNFEVQEGDSLFGWERKCATNKNESFADDSTTFTLFTYEALLGIKTMLLEFTNISGLKCNFEKTSIMRIGDTLSEYDKRIDSLGFSIVEKCTLLGFVINGNGDFKEENFKMVDKKVNGILNFWRPFNLSFTGKITIVKTLVVTAINYHASVLRKNGCKILKEKFNNLWVAG
jgi:Reverse transcriptase (RNA-dependent DNA polymerase)